MQTDQPQAACAPQNRADQRVASVTCPRALPDLFVVGAAKAGTTALYHYFRMHPQVFVPELIKETNFMAFADGLPPLTGPRDREFVGGSITCLADYEHLYRGRTTEVVAADVSPGYLYHAQAAGRIAALCPQAKIVIVLRNPVEAAFSMYAMMRRDEREPCRNFWTAFELSAERMAAGWEWAWDYQQCFKYARQVEGYLAHFPAGQLFIRRYEDLKKHPAEFHRDLAQFIGIEPIDLQRANRRQNIAPRRCDLLVRTRNGRRVLRAARAAAWLSPEPLAARIRRAVEAPAFRLTTRQRRRLVDYFGPDILQLSELLSWDLRAWLKV